MDTSATTVHDNPATRKALFMALIGMGLLAYVFAGWLELGTNLSAVDPAGYSVTPTGEAAYMPSDGTAAAAMTVGFTLLIAACVVLLKSREDMPSTLRDPLTGLYTRLYAAEALAGLIARDDRARCSGLVLVRVEIDAIDEVARRYGAEAVEMVMGSVGRHIRSQTREDDLPVEPDGHGFAIYLHCEELDQARAFCRRLATLLRSEQLDFGGDVIKVSAHMQATARKLDESIESLQQRAAGTFSPMDARQGRQIEV